MKKKILAAFAATAALVPLAASAEHMDVIAMEMTGECTLGEFMRIVGEFNKWGADHGYQAKVAAPLQSDNLVTYFWLGTSANTAVFGAAWDAWRDGQSDATSTPAKLQARFDKCSKNMQRRGYDVY